MGREKNSCKKSFEPDPPPLVINNDRFLSSLKSANKSRSGTSFSYSEIYHLRFAQKTSLKSYMGTCIRCIPRVHQVINSALSEVLSVRQDNVLGV